MSDDVQRVSEEALMCFLEGTPWGTWLRKSLPSDASSRRYFRLYAPNGETVIAMDAQAQDEGHTQNFEHVTHFLKGLGVCVPQILAHDEIRRLMVLEDLGGNDVKSYLHGEPSRHQEIYDRIVDVLLCLHQAQGFVCKVPLSAEVACLSVGETLSFYGKKEQSHAVLEALKEAFDQFVSAPTRLMLRDFHAENLIWRPERQGVAQLGVLDYQDAMLAPAGYDLVSFTRDVRRDVPSSVVEGMTRNFSDRIGVEYDVFSLQCACLSIQRNLRILGVFSRLITQYKKPKYARYMMRVWSLIEQDLQHPSLADLRKVILRDLPHPADSNIADYL